MVLGHVKKVCTFKFVNFCPEVPESRSENLFRPKMAILDLNKMLAAILRPLSKNSNFFDMPKDHFCQVSAILAQKCGFKFKLLFKLQYSVKWSKYEEKNPSENYKSWHIYFFIKQSLTLLLDKF